MKIKMMTITNQNNGITLRMPQYSFWTKCGCHQSGKTKRDAKEIDKALCRNNRERARELLREYDCVIEFFDYDDFDQDGVPAQPLYSSYKETQ